MAAKELNTLMPLPRLLLVGLTIHMLAVPAVLMLPIASPLEAPALLLRGDLFPSFFPPALLGDFMVAALACDDADDMCSSVAAADAASSPSAPPPAPFAGEAGPFASVALRARAAFPTRFLFSMALQTRANSWYSGHASPAATMNVGGAIWWTSIFSRSQ